MVVIVTDRCYIVSNKIISMHLEECLEDIRFNGGRYVTVPVTIIKVAFEPLAPHPNSRDSVSSVDIKVYGRKKSISLFKEMVSQIRNQCPDQLFLDQIAEKFLMGAIEDDATAEEICGIREKKRRSKKVLRAPKKRTRRSR